MKENQECTSGDYSGICKMYHLKCSRSQRWVEMLFIVEEICKKVCRQCLFYISSFYLWIFLAPHLFIYSFFLWVLLKFGCLKCHQSLTLIFWYFPGKKIGYTCQDIFVLLPFQEFPFFTDSRMYDKPGPYLKMCYELPYLLTGSTFNLFNDEKVSE